jgi:hypothetical protein
MAPMNPLYARVHGVDASADLDDVEVDATPASGVTVLPSEVQAAVAEAKVRHAAEIDAIVNGYPSPNTSGVANTTAGSPNTSDDQADSTDDIPTGVVGVNPGNEPGTSGTDGNGQDEGGPKASELDGVAVANGVAPAAESQSIEEVATAATVHGELERPAKTASTDAWVAYAKADPAGEPFDLTARAGLRDDIAKHYLGE